MGSGWLLFIPDGLWMVAVHSWRALDGCYYFLMASGCCYLFLMGSGWLLFFLNGSGWLLFIPGGLWMVVVYS